MAPATLAGATLRVRTDRSAWDRDSISNAIREWVATYGEPPRAADWNPSSAKWAGQLWRVERYRAGRADGSPWPALNTAKRPFGGSLNEAIRAAGFEPARPGPKRRSDVDPEQADRAVISPEGRAMLEAALARAREAERRVGVLEGRLGRAAAVARAKPVAKLKPKPEPKVRVVREKVVDEAMRANLAEARAAAKRLAARLERSEATVGTLRGERRELRAEQGHLADRAAALERLLDAARAEAERPPEVVTVRESAPGATEVRAARIEAARARRDAEAAELRAAGAERELRETVAAIRGEPRRLTAAELAELRAKGPNGPAVLAGALKALTTARTGGNPTQTREALRRVAQAAIGWQERIR